MSWDERPGREGEVEVKPVFEERYRALLGDAYDEFMSCNLTYLRRAIRVNTLKASTPEIKRRLEDAGWELTPVPWSENAFWIEGDRLDIGNLLEHQLGYIYIQDPASMLPPLVLGAEPGMRVLDMCASPGSKTSQVAADMQNTGIIVANDVEGMRLAPLGVNLQRLGVTNAILTRKDGRHFAKHQVFDRVMVDAPCSGTGTIRRSLKSLGMYNPNQVAGLAKLQLQLLEAGYAALVPGGIVTYSTCTVEPEENEGVLAAFLHAHPEAVLEPITLDIKREELITHNPITGEDYAGVDLALRIHPYTNDSEGFFVARIKKPA